MREYSAVDVHLRLPNPAAHLRSIWPEVTIVVQKEENVEWMKKGSYRTTLRLTLRLNVPGRLDFRWQAVIELQSYLQDMVERARTD